MYYRAFWQRRCRAAAAGAVLKPSGGNCAVLPQSKWPKTTVPLWLSDFDDWLCLSFAAILSVLQRSKTPYHKPYCRQLLFLFISFFRRVFQFLVAFFILRNCHLHQRKGEHDRNNAGHTGNSQAKVANIMTTAESTPPTRLPTMLVLRLALMWRSQMPLRRHSSSV